MKNIFLLCCMVCIVPRYGFTQVVGEENLHKKVTPLHHSLAKLLQLEPIAFEYDHKNFPHLNLENGVQYGFKAENVGRVFPELVSTRMVSYRVGKNLNRDAKINTVDELGLIPFLVASIQEQQLEIEKLRDAISNLKEDSNKAAK